MKLKTICLQLQSLSNETRLRIFKALIAKGGDGLCAGDLCDVVSIPCSAMSFHLNHLTNANLISSRRDGRFIIYRANSDNAKCLTNYLTDHCCGED